jgi:5-methylcytosine-specific restriction endonuclease McrA
VKIRERVRRWREENRERHREAARRWSEQNRVRARENARRWYADNHERALEAKRRWYWRNRDQAREASREWYRRNQERHRENGRRWYQRNSDLARTLGRLKEARRRARLRDALVIPFSRDQLMQRMAYFGERCWVCGGPFEHVDHVIAIARGGPHVLANLRPICRSCNARKGARDWREWVAQAS